MTELNSPSTTLWHGAAPPKSRKSAPVPAAVSIKADPECPLDPAERHALISRLAYLKAESRGFVPGHELEDWLAAEREFDGNAV